MAKLCMCTVDLFSTPTGLKSYQGKVIIAFNSKKRYIKSQTWSLFSKIHNLVT